MCMVIGVTLLETKVWGSVCEWSTVPHPSLPEGVLVPGNEHLATPIMQDTWALLTTCLALVLILTLSP